ncbi:Cof-type HAD-IIB family hydrolase [Ruminococcus sp. 5_1_39BFAA]|uniref:Cof-type HAD-IIB family hydrolase n=1 Tax=Ruminococcus sp. 5_1_39BFAA TaxID=457412 RepID=UPI00356B3143
MGIRLIASDLDGTLLTDKKEISEMTRRTLEETARRGICFVPATGRSFSAVPKEVLGLPNTEYVIISNGAAIYSLSQGKRIYECILDPKAVTSILSKEKPAGMVMEVFMDGVPYSGQDYVENPKAYGATDYGAAYVKRTRRPVADISHFAMENRHRLDSITFVGGTPAFREDFRHSLLTDVPGIYVTSSVSHLLEIGNENAGKGNTLLKLLELLQISPEEAMAFGDADNDISMLSAVKYGIAMGNGTETCKEAAYSVTDTNEKDGVAKAVLQYLANNS